MLVVILSSLLCVAAGIALMVGISLTLPGTALDKMWAWNRPAYAAFQSLGFVTGPLFLLLAVVTGATAVGLFHGRSWARWMALGIFGVSGLGDVVSLFVTGDIGRSGSGALIAAAFVVSLMARRVRDFCCQAG